MKFLKITLLLLLNIGFANALFADCSCGPCPCIAYEDGGTGSENTLTFNVEGLDELESNGRSRAYYDYFWKFGNGDFSFEECPSYTFAVSGSSINVELELTQIYSDDEIEELDRLINITTGNDDPETENNSVRMEDESGDATSVVLQYNRDPVEGKPVTFMITYTEGFALYDGIKITYDPSEYTFDHLDLFHDEAIHCTSSGEAILSFPALASGEQRTLFVTFTTAMNISRTTSVTAQSFQIGPNDAIDTYESVTKAVGKSYDPNQKVVNDNFHCIDPFPASPPSLTYHIDFENVGTGPASYIRIEDPLDDYLDAAPVFSICTEALPCGVVFVKPWSVTPLTTSQVFKKGNRLVWEFEAPVLLKGKRQPGYGINFPPQDTKGYVDFSIDTQTFPPLPGCVIIPNSCQIYFDGNRPITTDPEYVLIEEYCDGMLACRANCGSSPNVTIGGGTCCSTFLGLNQYRMYKGDSVQLGTFNSTPMMPDTMIVSEFYKWYPADGVSDIYAADPWVKPTDNTTYAVTILFDMTINFPPPAQSLKCFKNAEITLKVISCPDGSTPIPAKVRTYLEGPYQTATSSMRTDLLDNGLLPLEQPYNQSPWNYTGSESMGNYNNFPSNTVDWVLVEAVSTLDPCNVQAQRAALLLDDGRIVDPTQAEGGIMFCNILPNSDYNIVVRHRNHLAVMSANPITLPNQNAYNFSTAESQALGSGQLTEVDTSLWVMLAGDFNADGVLTVTDFNFYATETSLINEYRSSDCNLDRAVTVADFNYYSPNSSVIGISMVRYPCF